jgi:cytochrome c55X
MSAKCKLLLWPVFSLAMVLISADLSIAQAGSVSPVRKSQLINLLRQDCGSCHGMTLQGGLGKPLLPQALEIYDQDEIANFILEGVPGTPMPPWKALLSKADANWIAKILKRGLDK